MNFRNSRISYRDYILGNAHWYIIVVYCDIQLKNNDVS